MENAQQKQNSRIAVVRAFPHPPYKNRWAGSEYWVDDIRTDARARPRGKHGLPWPAHEIKVEVVSNPEPYDPLRNGGVPTQISPRTLRDLERDPRIAVYVQGEGGDPAESVRMAAQLAETEEHVQEARRKLAEAGERASADHQRYQIVLHSTEKKLVEESAKVSTLEAELATLRQQMAEQKKGGKR